MNENSNVINNKRKLEETNLEKSAKKPTLWKRFKTAHPKTAAAIRKFDNVAATTGPILPVIGAVTGAIVASTGINPGINEIFNGLAIGGFSGSIGGGVVNISKSMRRRRKEKLQKKEQENLSNKWLQQHAKEIEVLDRTNKIEEEKMKFIKENPERANALIAMLMLENQQNEESEQVSPTSNTENLLIDFDDNSIPSQSFANPNPFTNVVNAPSYQPFNSLNPFAINANEGCYQSPSKQKWQPNNNGF